MGQAQRLTCQGALIVGQEGQRVGNILHRRKLTVNGVPQHDVLHHLFLGNAQITSLLGDLFFYQRSADIAGADGVGVDAVLRALPGEGLGKAVDAVTAQVKEVTGAEEPAAAAAPA